MKNDILVSVGVLTYNSSSTIIETLESIKRQTYPKIELVISDDCSRDDTVEKCKDWLVKNEKYFESANLLTVDENTGVSANANRCQRASTGLWIKIIAGDDILFDKCVSICVNFAQEHPKAMFIGSQHIPFRTVDNEMEIEFSENDKIRIEKLKLFNSLDISEQYKLIFERDLIFTPTLFYKKDLFKIVSFNEKYKTLEDYPFKLDVLRLGIKYYHIEQDTVYYRISNNSISNNVSNKLFSSWYKTYHQFEKDYKYPLWNYCEKFLCSYRYIVKLIFDNVLLNRRNAICYCLLQLMLFQYTSLFKKIIEVIRNGRTKIHII